MKNEAIEAMTKAVQAKGWDGVTFVRMWRGLSIYACTTKYAALLGASGEDRYLWYENGNVVWADNDQTTHIMCDD